MSELIPASQSAAIDSNSAAGSAAAIDRLRALPSQPGMKQLLPWFGGLAGLGLLALTWLLVSPAPQRVLYSSLADGERAEVAAALDQASITYNIDNATGAVTVGEDDLYRARMTVASQGALQAPETGTAMIDALPMGASRTLEGDRLRAAQERELQMTIAEIDGVEAVRVHLAKAEKSLFVRQEDPPSASVMLRLVRGKTLSDSQVNAIANLVAGSVPALTVESVRIVDQNGRLLSNISSADSDRLELQARTEAKLRAQLAKLLTPMFGEGNFSSEVQVDLNMEEITTARETYDNEGVIRREQTSETTNATTAARGVPGATANTPPLDPDAEQRAPEGGEAGGEQTAIGASNANRLYELDREVAVTSSRPGTVRRISIAVAINDSALENAEAADLAEIEKLVAAAAGIDTRRGDTVAVMTRAFQAVELKEPAFWETPWFATIVRHVVALISVLLVLLLAVRPLLKMLKPKNTLPKDDAEEELQAEIGENDEDIVISVQPVDTNKAARITSSAPEDLTQQVELARRITREQPEDAVQALRRMLHDNGQAQPEAGR